jgi:hypothetical protein
VTKQVLIGHNPEYDAMRERANELAEAIRVHKASRLPHMTNADDRALWSLIENH